MAQESGLDKNYTIPRKRPHDIEYSNHPYVNAVNPVLNNYYYGNQGEWQPGASYTQYPTFTPPQYPTGPGYGTTNPVEPITQNICNTLSKIKEKPKGIKKNIFRETVPDLGDSTLPKTLTAMFQPLYCKLCLAQLSSNVMAKMHYKSKNHEKKIKKFLIEYSEKTGKPLHKRATLAGTMKTEEEKNPRWFHCDICDIELTGKLHAESHYMGKNHQKALMGQKKPAGQGYYNDDGKWVRQQKTKKLILKDGEDTFGLSFRKDKAPEPEIQEVQKESPSSSTSNSLGKFTCDVCNVGTTSQEQLEMHFSGQKHLKKLKQLGFISNVPSSSGSSPTASIDSLNLSVYRTPSGGFYCPTCNMSLVSDTQFKLHLKSKGHMKKSSQK